MLVKVPRFACPGFCFCFTKWHLPKLFSFCSKQMAEHLHTCLLKGIVMPCPTSNTVVKVQPWSGNRSHLRCTVSVSCNNALRKMIQLAIASSGTTLEYMYLSLATLATKTCDGFVKVANQHVYYTHVYI